ncbi:unnamed protein product [Toxocara canis]|uniref:BTB domain-containing protein n=1 Tax=Toxocara canis TaxID=6265 RepID=A0A183UVB6_TOXCA|nr:unnamed protein product [Toxocara canis]
MRQRLKNEGIIEKLVELSELSTDMIRLLCTYTYDAYGRMALIEKGALDLLIKRMSESSSRQERAVIVSSFRHFIYCSVGSAHLCQSKMYVDTVVRHIIEYLDKYKHQCEPFFQLIPLDDEGYATSESDSRFSSEMKRNTSEVQGGLKRTSSCLGEMGGRAQTINVRIEQSPSASPQSSWSPSRSPVSPSISSTVGTVSPSSSFQDILSLWMGETQSVSGSEPDVNASLAEKEDEEERRNNFEKEQEASDDKQVLDVLLRYLSEAPTMDMKVARALKRIARSENMVERFLSLQFHTRVLHTLRRKRCRLVRHVRHCEYCSQHAEYGDEMLREFALHVDSPFGAAVLKDNFKSSEPVDRVKTCIAVVQLIRDEVRQCRMFVEYRPVEFLIDFLRRILMSDDFETAQQQTTYKNGPKIFYQIIAALSTIVQSRSLTSLVDSHNVYHKVQLDSDNGCVLRILKQTTIPVPELISFVNTEGVLIDAIPKQQLTSGSEYFRGMFSNAFVEQSTGRDTFTFKEEDEHCSESEFRQFLHYVCGCRSAECFAIRTAHDVVTMLQLADRYLCSTLTDMLLSTDGPAMYYISGDTLAEFLSASLCAGAGATQRLRDACICVLMRYSTEDEVLRSLGQLAGDAMAVDAFIEHLTSFIQRNIVKNRYI